MIGNDNVAEKRRFHFDKKGWGGESVTPCNN